MPAKILLICALVAWAATLTHAQTTRTVRDGVFTDAQAARGQAIYQKQCASCHGDALQGVQGPPLVADAFSATGTRSRSRISPARSVTRCPLVPPAR